MTAGRRLEQAKRVLGLWTFQLLVLACAHGHTLSAFCRSKREKNTCADILRAALDDLADLWDGS